MATVTSARAAALGVLVVAALVVSRAIAGNVVFNEPPTQTIHVSASDR